MPPNSIKSGAKTSVTATISFMIVPSVSVAILSKCFPALLNANMKHMPVTAAEQANAMRPFTPPATPAASGAIKAIMNGGISPLSEFIRFSGSYESLSLAPST